MASLGVLAIFISYFYLSFGFLLDDDSLQNLIGLINHEKTLRAQVEQEMQVLQNDIEAAQKQHQSSRFNLFLSPLPIDKILA